MISLSIIAISALVLILYAVMLNNYLAFDSINEQAEQQPIPVSLIVPFKNEASVISRLLKSIKEQDYPLELVELIMVDDHSSDDSKEVIQALLKEFPTSTYITSDGVGKKQALLTGIKHTCNEWVLLTDADTIASKTWIKAMLNQRLDNTLLVAGPITIQKEDRFNVLLPMLQLEHIALQQLTRLSIARQKPLMANGANLLFKKEIAQQAFTLANLEIASGDDSNLLFAAWQKDATSIQYASTVHASVSTTIPTTPHQIWKQRVRWASKLKTYEQVNHVTSTGWVIALANMAFILLLACCIAGIYSWFYLVLYIILKTWVDQRFIHSIKSVLASEISLGQLIGAEIGYPFYFVAVLVGSLLHQPRKATTPTQKW